MDERAFSWQHLLPSDVIYRPIGGPAWWQAAFTDGVPNNRQVPVFWNVSARELPALDTASAVIAVNSLGLSRSWLVSAGFTHIRHFAVMPSCEDARWFIPLESPRVASGAFRLYTPFHVRARAKHLAAQTAARGGIPGWFRDNMWIAQRGPSPLDRALAAASIDSSRLAISTGTPGRARKPTIAVLGVDGQIQAIAKVASTPLTRRRLQNEAACLRRLANGFTDHLHLPRLLLEEDLDGRKLVVQELLPGRVPGRHLTGRHERFLATLASGTRLPVNAIPFMQKLRRRVNDQGAAWMDLAPALMHMNRLLADAAFPLTVLHGDFAPWNLRCQEGQIGAFDWEYGDLDGVPLLDAIHHQLQVGFLLRDWSVSDALAALHAQQSHGLRSSMCPAHIRGLQLVYLLNVLLRRREEGFPDSDEAMQRYAHLLKGLMATSDQIAS